MFPQLPTLLGYALSPKRVQYSLVNNGWYGFPLWYHCQERTLMCLKYAYRIVLFNGSRLPIHFSSAAVSLLLLRLEEENLAWLIGGRWKSKEGNGSG